MEHLDSQAIEEAVAEYAARRDAYSRLSDEIRKLTTLSLNQTTIAYAAISHRVKTVESFREKLDRKAYRDPLADVEDLGGVRVVCLYDEDRPEIEALLRKSFDVLKVEDQRKSLGADRMGYSGTHMIVRLGDNYRGGIYHGITDLKCEIQIRTAVQDAWAMISHGMVYKHEADVPLELRRDLNQAATLLEVAQSKFDDLRRKRGRYLEEIRSVAPEETKLLDRRIDFDTLTAYSQWKFPELSPDDKLTRMLIQDLNRNKYRKLADLDHAVETARPAVEAYRVQTPELFRNSTDYLTKSLGFADKEFRGKHGFGQKTREAFPQFEQLIGHTA